MSTFINFGQCESLLKLMSSYALIDNKHSICEFKSISKSTFILYYIMYNLIPCMHNLYVTVL